MFDWLKRDKKAAPAEEKPASALQVNSAPLLPLHSAFATMIKTHAYLDLQTQEETWLIARRNGETWDIIAHSKKQGAEEPIIHKQYDGRNRGVSYAHVLCRLAEFEHIRHSESALVKDESIDQNTTAKHFLIVANHDGVGIDTDGKPCMSTQGEFFEGSFSVQQTAAVFNAYHNPTLQRLDGQSVVQQNFEQSACLPLFDDINALAEVEILKKTAAFLRNDYSEVLASIITLNNSTVCIEGVSYPQLRDEKAIAFLDKKSATEKDFLTVESLSEFDKASILQIIKRIPILRAMGNYRLFKADTIPLYSKYSVDEKSGAISATEMAFDSKRQVKPRVEILLKDDIRNAVRGIDPGPSPVASDIAKHIEQVANDFIKIAETPSGRELFLAEKNKIQPIIAMLEKEIERLNALAVTQANTEKLVVKDPKTGALRVFKPEL